MSDDKRIDDIIAMLDGSVQRGDGHINVKVDESQDSSQEITRGCADCSANPTACSVPTIELPGDEDFQK